MIEVAVCSPIPALRAGLSALIDGDPDCAVWAAVASLDGLPAPLPEGCVIVTDLAGMEGILQSVAAASLVEETGTGSGSPGWLPGAALLLISEEPAPALPRDFEASLRAWGAITPESSSEALRAAVHALAEGLSVFSPELLPERTGDLDDRSAAVYSRPVEGGLVEALTERECEVLRRLSDGLTNKQTALALGISEHTVKFHVSSIYAKLGVTNRAEAVREGARRGLIAL